MQRRVNIPFSELLIAVRQLTPAQRSELQAELSIQAATAMKKSRLKELLLTGPALTDKQLETIRQTRKEVNEWRTRS